MPEPIKPVVPNVPNTPAPANAIVAPNIYVPTFAQRTSDVNITQRRVLLCGNYGDGKTYQSIMTSPNPTYLDIDNGISDKRLKEKDIPKIPIYDSQWTDKNLGSSIICNSTKKFIKEHAPKMTIEQTLIIDSLSLLSDSVEDFLWAQTPTSKETKEKDGFAFFDAVKDYYTELFGDIRKLKCHVIFPAHLEEIRNKKNPLAIDFYAPLIAGKMKQRIGQYFTDVIRIQVEQKTVGTEVTSVYKWQVQKDTMFPYAKCRGEVKTLCIPADFRELMKL